MKRTILYMLIPLCTFLMSCDSEDTPVGFPVGSWKLSAIVFENGPNATELTTSRLNQFTLEFMADGSAISKAIPSNKTLNWVYDSTTNALELSDGGNSQAYTLESSGDVEFRYQVTNIGTMANASPNQIRMAELAANTFNQNKSDYDPSGSLSVYFKFEQQ